LRYSRLFANVGVGLVGLTAATPASAAVPHTVGPGESLWSIAAANNFTTRSMAAANGLGPDSHVILGSTIQIPSEPEAAAALAAQATPATGTATPASVSGAGTHTVAPGESLGAIAARSGTSVAALAAANGLDPAAYLLSGTVLRLQGSGGSSAAAPTATPAASTAAPKPLGSYTVRAGESLGSIAASSGASVAQVAAANGLDPSRPLPIGTVLKLPGASSPSASGPAPAKTVVPAAAPYASAGRISAGEVKQVASGHGIPPSLAAAVGWQESGFNNGVVSSANARGVMQILPGTWQWVQDNLARERLDPSSPRDNVQAGSLYLAQLARDTGGDLPTAVASYYQGLSSVRKDGMFPETERYVANVLALQRRFADE